MTQSPVVRPPKDPWSNVKFNHESEHLRKGGAGAVAMVLLFAAAVGAIVGGLVGVVALRYVGFEESTKYEGGTVAGMEIWIFTLLLFTVIGAALGLGFAVYSLVQERMTRSPGRKDPE